MIDYINEIENLKYELKIMKLEELKNQ